MSHFRLRRKQASTLIGGLAGERTRWTEDSEKSADLKRRLVGDCALGSAFVSYCGPFNQEFRQYMVTDKFTVDLQVSSEKTRRRRAFPSDFCEVKWVRLWLAW